MCTAFVHFIFNVRNLVLEKQAAIKVGEDGEQDESAAQGDDGQNSNEIGADDIAKPENWAQVLFVANHLERRSRRFAASGPRERAPTISHMSESGLKSSRLSADRDAARQESP